MHQIDLFRQYPLEVQEELFFKMIDFAKYTEFGLKYHFYEIKNYEQYKRLVPLHEYEDFKPWIERLMNNKQNLLWASNTKWFAKSSGTTSDRSKLIPVTKESLFDCHYKGGKDLLAIYYDNHPKRKLYNGRHLIVGGSAQVNQLSADSYFGDLSAIIVKNLPWWAEIRRTPSREIALMSEWESKIERMAQNTINDDVYILAGVPSWTMVLANRVLEITGKSTLKEVWPNLEMFMHGGVSFEPYREHFKKLIGFPDMNYVETYNASEGFFGIQDQVHSDDLLLMLDYGIFYEFIPMKDFEGTDSKNVISLGDVEVGEQYAIVISTNGGLWRYILGDTIRFTSKVPYRFKITGRTKSYINTFGEELIVDNADAAIGYASMKTDAQIREYTVAPVFMTDKEKGSHEWLIEFLKEPTDLHQFMVYLDEHLRSINSDYDAKRHQNMVLELPTLRLGKKGVFDTWLKNHGKLGGQNKIPRLANDRELLEQILLVNNSL
ncbi:MAG: GH3 auxin-responsive promoter family protein [Bacteroidota bacterium]